MLYEVITVFNANGNLIVQGSVYYCGGEIYGTLLGDVKGLGSLLKSKIPDFRT